MANVAACDAEVTTGCGQTPAVIKVGENTDEIAVSTKTNTVYAPSVGNPFGSGTTVYVINGATCDGTSHSGCAHIAAKQEPARDLTAWPWMTPRTAYTYRTTTMATGRELYP